MAIKVTFKDGSVVVYPEGNGLSDSPDGSLIFVNDSSGMVVASIPQSDVKSAEKVG